MALGSGAFEGQYSFGSRFEEGVGTNPEELIGAAHAGCYSMALSGVLGRAGITPEEIATTARVHLDKVGDGFTITRIELQHHRTRARHLGGGLRAPRTRTPRPDARFLARSRTSRSRSRRSSRVAR